MFLGDQIRTLAGLLLKVLNNWTNKTANSNNSSKLIKLSRPLGYKGVKTVITSGLLSNLGNKLFGKTRSP